MELDAAAAPAVGAMEDLRTLRVGFIGAGRMAAAVARGMVRAGGVPPVNIIASAPSNNNLDKFLVLGCKTTHSNLEVLKNSTVVFLATKPQIIPVVLREIAPAVTSDHRVVSMAAGITLQSIEDLLPAKTRVFRMMPNLACVVQAGAIMLARGTNVDDLDTALVKRLLSRCGLCEEGPESHIDIHTGLSGSGIAYVYVFAEALAEGAVKMGMPGAMANKIAAQTLLGAARMIQETGEHPAVLRGAVCTPAGTTIHALHELEKGALRSTVMNAVETATNMARELGKKKEREAQWSLLSSKDVGIPLKEESTRKVELPS